MFTVVYCLAAFFVVSTGFDHYTDTTTICDQRTVWKLIKPLGIFWVWWSRGVLCPFRVANSPLAMWHEGVGPIKAG